uniref:Gamma-secretase-activating protein C-terminal domain-containing protein n=1 Tax=Periophthalmus magnuspinnatus TaxID=409849 RepID=A0A3B3ZWX4_9GOBI
MFRILEAAVGLCLPLPPGFHTLLAVLAVRCLPRHSFLQYIDHKLLQLTETFVARLMTDLDNSDDNEKMKFSILKRLPQVPLYKILCFFPGTNPFEEQENVDTRFVEETALKQTFILLGFEEK